MRAGGDTAKLRADLQAVVEFQREQREESPSARTAPRKVVLTPRAESRNNLTGRRTGLTEHISAVLTEAGNDPAARGYPYAFTYDET